MKKVLLAALLVVLFIPVHGLQCYYYRIRADDILTADNVVERNCSSLVSSCVKIISRIELSQQEQSEAPSTIEGRCAFTKNECENREEQCSSVPPIDRYGVTIHDYKCCSGANLSNGKQSINSNTLIFVFVCVPLLILQSSALYPSLSCVHL
uniref:Protein sleepless n=2 Tax=Haemonchus contortus TaxID=6289 RepID=A0A7I5E5L4_HAECO